MARRYGRSPRKTRDSVPDGINRRDRAVEDSSGARFQMIFADDGKIGGVAYARFWKWEQSGGKVRITYDNGLGVRVVWSGTVENDTMSGTANGPRGRKWTWRAERLPARAPGPASEARRQTR